jgi:uncharacterized membrane protein
LSQADCEENALRTGTKLPVSTVIQTWFSERRPAQKQGVFPPVQYIVAYVAALIVFGTVDVVWLVVMGNRLYKPTLDDILLPAVRPWPAIVFYSIFPIGIIVFAALPGLRGGGFATTLGLGLLLGAIAYATYDLTNLATIRNWTLQLALIDIAYGALVTALSAAASLWIVRLFD